MKYILMFIVLASITSCISNYPTKHKVVSVTLREIILEKRWDNTRMEWIDEVWYKYESIGYKPFFLPVPLDNVKAIGSIHIYYVPQ